MAKTVVNLSDQMAVFVQKTNLISTHVGDLVTLTTTNDSDLVGAVNELDSAQGNIASLSTTDKSSLVAAVNEVKGEVNNFGSGFSGFLRSNANDVVTAGSIRFDDTVPLVIGTDSDFTLTHAGGTTTATGNITFTGATTVSNQFTSDSATINGDIDATGDFRSSIAGTEAAPNFAITSGGLGVNGMFTPSANTLAFSSASTERMRISSTGAVGINNSIPDSFYAGGNNLVVGSGSGSEGITIYGGAESNIFFADGTAIADNLVGRIEYSHVSNDMLFYTNNSYAMRIDNSGNLLVGTATANPADNNDASGLQLSPIGTIQASASASTPAIFNRGSDGAAVAFLRSGSLVGSISITTTSTTYNTTSDKRLKDNIETLQNGTKLLEEMRPVTFDWKTDGSSDTGFIAQEMLEVMPTAVNPGETEDDMMSMDYGRITPIIVAALQEANKKIEELQNRIEELEAK